MNFLDSISSFFKTPQGAPNLPSPPQYPGISYQNLELPNANVGLDQFLGQSNYIPQLANLTGSVNTAYQNQLYKTTPSLKGNLDQFGANTSSLLNGQIPQDVQEAIQRSSAQSGIAGGTGGAQINKNLTARDFGLTSLNLINQGGSNLNAQVGQSQALNPMNVASTVFTPQQLLGRQDQLEYYNNNIQNQTIGQNAGTNNQNILNRYQNQVGNNQINYANSQLRSPFSQVVGNAIGSIFSAPFNAISSAGNVIGNAPSTITGALLGGNGAGSGGGSNFSPVGAYDPSTASYNPGDYYNGSVPGAARPSAAAQPGTAQSSPLSNIFSSLGGLAALL